MPIALIKILEGRSPEKKRRLIESVSQAMAESLDMPIDGVRVLVEEVPPDCWGAGARPSPTSLWKAAPRRRRHEVTL